MNNSPIKVDLRGAVSGKRKSRSVQVKQCDPQIHVIRLAPLERVGAIALVVVLAAIAVIFGFPKALAVIHFLIEG
jgi:hypothetical protein